MGNVAVFVTTEDGARLHVIGESGDAPLVLSNSLGTDVSLFEEQLPVLGVGRAIWRYDTRGHGQSAVTSGDYSIDRLGRDLIAVIDATGAARVDLCGVSIGGLTALWVAVNRPHRVRRLVVANSAARIGDEAMWKQRIRAARVDGMLPLAEASMLRWFTPGFRQSKPDVVAHFRRTIEQTSVDGYTSCCAALRDADLRPVVGQVACPTLIVTGRHDVATPPEQGGWLGSHVPGARVAELDAAHLSNVECAAGFNAIVGEFLAEGDRVHHG